MTPLVSIIIPSYKCGRYICETLESISSQTHTNWEILVCEDGIYDDTAEKIRIFAQKTKNRVHLISNETNHGVSHARNRLLDDARGNFIAFIDADDTWTVDHLEYSLSLIESTGTDWIIGGLNLMDPLSRIIQRDVLARPLPVSDIPTALLHHNFILTSSIVAGRDVFGRGLRFDTTLKIGEDLDLCIRMIKNNFRPCFSTKATLNYRKHPSSTTADVVRFPEEFSRVFEKYLGDSTVDQTYCRGQIQNMLQSVIRMTWRRQPSRSRHALMRLRCLGALPLRTWPYALLLRLRQITG